METCHQVFIYGRVHVTHDGRSGSMVIKVAEGWMVTDAADVPTYQLKADQAMFVRLILCCGPSTYCHVVVLPPYLSF
jgi:hypothetical protein